MIVYVIQPASGTTGTATCPPANPIVIGGGYTGIVDPNNTKQYTINSFPSATTNTSAIPGAWTVGLNDTDPSWTVYAVCSK
jgi:hypothetical protein